MKRAEALAKASVSSSNPYNNIPIGDFAKDSSFGDVMYAEDAMYQLFRFIKFS